MSKPLLLATVLFCLFSVEASAHGHRQYQHHAYRHGYQHHVYQRYTSQHYVSQRHAYQRQVYRQTPARYGMSDQVDPMQQPRIAPELSGSMITASPSFAHGYHRHLTQRHVDQGSAYQTSGDRHPLSYHRYARAWCGAYLSAYLGKNDRNLALARNWASEGTNAGGPGVGVVVVWPHHVGIITGQGANGEWIVHSGNDGGAVRTRARSLRGAIAFRRV
jgi:hypothetical protein